MRRRAKHETHRAEDEQWVSISVASSEGKWDDGWVGGTASFTIDVPPSAMAIRLVGYKPDWIPNLLLFARASEKEVRRQIMAVGHFVVDVPMAHASGRLEVVTRSEPVIVPSEVWESQEHRGLSWVFVGVEARVK